MDSRNDRIRAFAVTLMLVTSAALEERSDLGRFTLAFAGACALGSVYGFLLTAWPFRACGGDLGWRGFRVVAGAAPSPVETGKGGGERARSETLSFGPSPPFPLPRAGEVQRHFLRRSFRAKSSP